MAVCSVCEREMLTACGCKKIPFVHHGKKYNPIKVGDPEDFYFGEESGRCGDCGAKVGHYHHPGCDCERCPVCGGQAISCGCEDNSNLYRPVIVFDKRTPYEEVAKAREKNMRFIEYIDETQRRKDDIWFRFVRVGVADGYAVYQVVRATKTYCYLQAISLDGLLYKALGMEEEGFCYDYLVPQWGTFARVNRKQVEKLLKQQDAVKELFSK